MIEFRVIILAIILLVLPASGFSGCRMPSESLQRHEFSLLRMGTRVSLTFYIEDDAMAANAAEAAFLRLAELEDVISDWRSDSEIMVAQARPLALSGPISSDFARIMEVSLQVARQSEGAFDVSCGATTKLWRKARQSGVVPSEAEIQAAAATCDYRDLILGHDDHGSTLQINRAGLEFDFGGIGKGFGADEALAVLADRGITSALVDIGGDMAVGQPPPDRTGWRIELPDSKVLELSSCGIATSGATEQFMMFEGQRLSHLVNPETGRPMVDRGQVTIVATTAALADAWASVVLVAGLEEARRLAGTDSGIRFLVHSEH